MISYSQNLKNSFWLTTASNGQPETKIIEFTKPNVAYKNIC